MTLLVPWPSTAIRINAIRIAGNESWMSTMRMMSASVRPPKYAAGNPAARPMTSASTVAMTPTERLIRSP